jgi:DNA polymerase-3 subunit delta'
LNRVIGQERAIRFLTGLIEKERVPHALLFLGASGTGAVAAALDFVRALYCVADGIVACGQCKACNKIVALNHPDCSLLFPFLSRTKEGAMQAVLSKVWQLPYAYPLPDDNTTISIGQIREMQRQFAHSAFEGGWRTTLILHADHMRVEAANAMLKTLEEPPARSLLILTASQTDALLPTIVSRCHFVKFPALSPRDISDELVANHGIDQAAADFVGRTCGGNFRRALEMTASDVTDGQGRSFRFLEALLWGPEERTFEALEKLDLQEALDILKGAEVWLRDALLWQCGLASQMANVAQEENVQRLADVFDLARLTATVKKIESLREMNHRNVNMNLGLISLWRQIRSF